MKKYLLLTAALLLAACKPCDDPSNPECPNYCNDPGNRDCYNYDPCYGKAPVSAAFHMYERTAGGLMPDDWADYDTDTLCGWGIEFRALEENAEYEWRLGAETIRERSFVRHSFPREVPLTVTLIVRKRPNTGCFPDDDGRDTLTRTFVNYGAVAYCLENRIITPIGGRYEGVFANEPGVARQIEIMPCGMYIIPVPNQPDTVLRPGILGLLPTDTCGQWLIDADGPTFFGYRQWYFWADNRFTEAERACFRAVFVQVFQPFGTDSVYVRYKANVAGVDSLKSYFFRGKKTH